MLVSLFSTNSRAYERDWIHVLLFFSSLFVCMGGMKNIQSSSIRKSEKERECDYYIAPSLSSPSAKWFVFIIILFVLWHSRVLWLKQLVFNIKYFFLLFFSLMLIVTIFFSLCFSSSSFPSNCFHFLSLLLPPITFIQRCADINFKNRIFADIDKVLQVAHSWRSSSGFKSFEQLIILLNILTIDTHTPFLSAAWNDTKNFDDDVNLTFLHCHDEL